MVEFSCCNVMNGIRKVETSWAWSSSRISLRPVQVSRPLTGGGVSTSFLFTVFYFWLEVVLFLLFGLELFFIHFSSERVMLDTIEREKEPVHQVHIVDVLALGSWVTRSTVLRVDFAVVESLSSSSSSTFRSTRWKIPSHSFSLFHLHSVFFLNFFFLNLELDYHFDIVVWCCCCCCLMRR